MTDRAALLARLARLLATDSRPANLASRLCEASRSILNADGAAVTVTDSASVRVTLCATDAVMARLQDLQDVTGEGPCVDAGRHGTHFTTVLDGRPDPRWPEFTRTAWEAVGRVTLYSLPMHPAGDTVGVVSFYFSGPRQLSEPLDHAQLVADLVAAALLHDPAAATATAWASLADIPQACGMVIAQLHVSADDALAILRAHAYATDTTLKATARRVLDRTLDFRTDT